MTGLGPKLVKRTYFALTLPLPTLRSFKCRRSGAFCTRVKCLSRVRIIFFHQGEKI